jgi:LEA14-like dessication related protein
MSDRIRKRISCAVVCLLACVFVSCAAPQVSLKSALLTKISLQSLEIGLDLEIFNPNEYAVPLESIDWDLSLFDAPFTSGQTDFRRQLGAQARAQVRVPLGIQFSSLAMGVDKLLTGRAIPWGIEGGCTFRTPAGPIRIDFSGSGSWANPLRK